MSKLFPLFDACDSSCTRKLDDGLSLGWAQTQGYVPLDGTKVPADVWTVRSWALGHHAAITTYPHHDAEGAATFVIPISGVKNWVAIRAKQTTRNGLPGFLTELGGHKRSITDFLDRVEAETIHLNPGDLV